MVTRQDTWTLIIRYYPGAIAAGVTPVATEGFENGPEYYHAHKIRFQHPPKRGEFLDIVKWTPWMSVWDETLVPTIMKTQWPIPAHTKKRAYVDLVEDGAKVGELIVERDHFWINDYTERPMTATAPP